MIRELKILHVFSVFAKKKGLSSDDVGGGARGTVFQKIDAGRELVSKPSISLKKCWGGLP